MRHVLAVLAVTARIAEADSPWSEYSDAQPLRPATQLVEAACDMTVELRGAIAEVTVQQRLTNPGPATLAGTMEFDLPGGAQLIGVTAQAGRAKPETAVAVPAMVGSEKLKAGAALGADPVMVQALPSRDGHARFRTIVQPLDAEQEITIGTRWTAIAELRDGSIKLVLPGRGAAVPCHGLVHAAAGPGTSIERIRIGHAEGGARATATFDHAATDTELTAVLAFKRPVPAVWTQSTPLGDGWIAQAITVVTPAARSVSARRVLFVVDSSRSMELVGRHNVKRLVHEIGAALPTGSEVEAIAFDRTASRILGSWKAATADNVATIEQALASRPPGNGTDPVAALALAHQVIGDSRNPTMVIFLTDGVLGDITADAMTTALGGTMQQIDLHAISLAPGHMTVPATAVLRTAVAHYGGSHVEVPTMNVDGAIASLDQWLRPAWLELSLAGAEAFTIPDQLRAGTGLVMTAIVKKAAKAKLTGHGNAPIAIAAGSAPSVPLAQLALATLDLDGVAATAAARLRLRHPAVDDDRSFLVLTSAGTVAAHRRAMVVGGGPFTRFVDVLDPPLPAVAAASPILLGGSALDQTLIKLLLRTHLQPAAFACYQRALPTNDTLAGTARFTLEIGRGELTRASVTGLGNSTFDACLLDAAYKITPPLPNPDYNTDDRTIVNYPLTFSVREQKPFVIAGDADSTSPINIDAIKGGPPDPRGPRQPVKAGDTSTPLGNLRPTKTP
jgi:Mg-chelatase subunit ChlD